MRTEVQHRWQSTYLLQGSVLTSQNEVLEPDHRSLFAWASLNDFHLGNVVKDQVGTACKVAIML